MPGQPPELKNEQWCFDPTVIAARPSDIDDDAFWRRVINELTQKGSVERDTLHNIRMDARPGEMAIAVRAILQSRPAQTELERRVERLRAFVREVAPGGCKVLSNAACQCPLCDVDELAGAARRSAVND